MPILTGRNSLKTADYGGRFSIDLETSEYTLKVFNILDLIETLFGTAHLEQIAVIYEEIML